MKRLMLGVAVAALVTSCAQLKGLDLEKLKGMAQSATAKAQPNYGDLTLLSMKLRKVEMKKYIDTFMATMMRDEYEKFKDDELEYSENITKWTKRLEKKQESLKLGTEFELMQNHVFGKYDVKTEKFNVGENIVTKEGFYTGGDYYGTLIRPQFVIDSKKSSVKLPEVIKIKPINPKALQFVKIPKSSAKTITKLGDETSRNTNVKVIFELVKLKQEKTSMPVANPRTRLQIIHNQSAGFSDKKVNGLVAYVKIKKVIVMQPGWDDRILALNEVK